MRQGMLDLEVLARFDVLFAGKIATDQVDAFVGQMGEIGDGFLFDFARASSWDPDSWTNPRSRYASIAARISPRRTA
jgi:hypothetical protein